MRDDCGDKKFTKTFEPVPTGGIQFVAIESNRGSIWAQPNGGSLRGNPNTTVRWTCAEPFTIQFRQLGGVVQSWPNPKLQQAGNMYICEATLPSFPANDTAPYYEYTITIGELTLDPIVIVDKVAK